VVIVSTTLQVLMHKLLTVTVLVLVNCHCYACDCDCDVLIDVTIQPQKNSFFTLCNIEMQCLDWFSLFPPIHLYLVTQLDDAHFQIFTVMALVIIITSCSFLFLLNAVLDVVVVYHSIAQFFHQLATSMQ